MAYTTRNAISVPYTAALVGSNFPQILVKSIVLRGTTNVEENVVPVQRHTVFSFVLILKTF